MDIDSICSEYGISLALYIKCENEAHAMYCNEHSGEEYRERMVRRVIEFVLECRGVMGGGDCLDAV